MKRTYFMADAHLGTRTIADVRAHEQRIVNWLDAASRDAEAIYLLGDIFDFWFEYKTVVPKGYCRLLGKLCEITDSGIPVHFFTGNHDLWTFGYLEQEIGLIVHRNPIITQIGGKKFFLAHGDGLNDNSHSFKLLRAIFHNKLLQKGFRALPPTWGQRLGYAWSARNRRNHDLKGSFRSMEHEPLIRFAMQHSSQHNVDYYIFGHRHILLQKTLPTGAQIAIIGDFMQQFSYAVFDGMLHTKCLQ